MRPGIRRGVVGNQWSISSHHFTKYIFHQCSGFVKVYREKYCRMARNGYNSQGRGMGVAAGAAVHHEVVSFLTSLAGTMLS
jgi:hypothetical protein